QFIPPMREKTGGQAAIARIDLTGKQEWLKGGWWQLAGTCDQAGALGRRTLILTWSGDHSPVYWSDSTEPAHVDYDPNRQHGNLLYARPSDPYLPIAGPDTLWLLRLER
ncbi:MAG: hypothetical protein ACM3XM_09300, partial [Mycobacterium leprae]